MGCLLSACIAREALMVSLSGLPFQGGVEGEIYSLKTEILSLSKVKCMLAYYSV